MYICATPPTPYGRDGRANSNLMSHRAAVEKFKSDIWMVHYIRIEIH